jgi:hypothetical protein
VVGDLVDSIGSGSDRIRFVSCLEMLGRPSVIGVRVLQFLISWVLFLVGVDFFLTTL